MVLRAASDDHPLGLGWAVASQALIGYLSTTATSAEYSRDGEVGMTDAQSELAEAIKAVGGHAGFGEAINAAVGVDAFGDPLALVPGGEPTGPAVLGEYVARNPLLP
jgi:hypothetical protein